MLLYERECGCRDEFGEMGCNHRSSWDFGCGVCYDQTPCPRLLWWKNIHYDFLPGNRLHESLGHFVCRTSLKEHTGAIHSLACAPGGLRFVSGSADKSLIIWDATREKSFTICTAHDGAVRSVAWSANGKYVASGSRRSHHSHLDLGRRVFENHFPEWCGIVRCILLQQLHRVRLA